jgi:uncharacterized protein involved in exopolysaccharide biosynthesis
MSRQQESFLTVAEIAAALRNRWKLATLGSLLFALGTGSIVIFGLMPTYLSQGSLYVRLGKNTLTVDPTASSSQTISPMESRHQEVVSVRELVKSRSVIERVCERIGVERLLAMRSPLEAFVSRWVAKLPFPQGGRLPEGMTAEGVAARKQFESAIKYVNRVLTVESPKDTYLIHLEAKAHDPQVARDIVQYAMEEYQAVHMAAHKPSGSFRFFEKQLEDQRQKLLQLENKKRDELNQRQIMSVEAERELLQSRLASTTNRLSEITAALEGQRAKVAELKAQIDAQVEKLEVEQTGGIADAATDSIKSSVFALEVEHQQAAAIYHPAHPALQQKQRALAEAREIEESQPRERAQRREAINPTRLALQLAYATGLSEVEQLESELRWLQADRTGLKQREQQLHEDEIFFADLDRQIGIAISEFEAFSVKREQSKLTEAIDQEAFSDVNVAQSATLNFTKSGLSRTLLLAACLVGATFFGGACGIARELMAGRPITVLPVSERASASPEPAPPAVAASQTPAFVEAANQPSAAGSYRLYSGRYVIDGHAVHRLEEASLDRSSPGP